MGGSGGAELGFMLPSPRYLCPPYGRFPLLPISGLSIGWGRFTVGTRLVDITNVGSEMSLLSTMRLAGPPGPPFAGPNAGEFAAEFCRDLGAYAVGVPTGEAPGPSAYGDVGGRGEMGDGIP